MNTNYLPAELEKISKNVSVEKRNEVQNVLNSVFNGVKKMREQLEVVNVESIDDKVNMQLANTIRLGVREVRLEAEKIFDAKRAEVQQQMLNYKTEDMLWLKAKQTMQILTKEIEEAARWKEETRKRYDLQQHELKIQKRTEDINRYAPEIESENYKYMSDEAFAVFLAALEKKHTDKIEEEKRLEAERIAKEKAQAEERERMRMENEKLKKEAEEKEKQIAAERAKAEAERKAIEERARKEQEAAKIAAEKAEAERRKLEAELRAKAEAEAELRRQAEKKEQERLLAEEKANAAPDKEKLLVFAQFIDTIKMPEVTTPAAKKLLLETQILLTKVANHIRKSIDTLS